MREPAPLCLHTIGEVSTLARNRQIHATPATDHQVFGPIVT
jgi:hypothetical protein